MNSTKGKIMTDYELGYKHGYNHNGGIGVTKYPNNFNYMQGFKDGDYARVYQPSYDEPEHAGANDSMGAS
jgi:hypothetical protein